MVYKEHSWTVFYSGDNRYLNNFPFVINLGTLNFSLFERILSIKLCVLWKSFGFKTLQEIAVSYFYFGSSFQLTTHTFMKSQSWCKRVFPICDQQWVQWVFKCLQATLDLLEVYASWSWFPTWLKRA